MSTLRSDLFCKVDSLNAMKSTAEDSDVEEAAIMIDSENETYTLLDI